MDEQYSELNSRMLEIQSQLSELMRDREKEKDKQITIKALGKYHDIYLLLIGFTLTAMVGGFISYVYQKKMYDYQKKAINYESKQNEVTEFYKKVSDIITSRYLYARRLLTSFEEKDLPAKVEEVRNRYYNAVDEWSKNDAYNRAFIRSTFPDSVLICYVAVADNFTKDLHESLRKLLKAPNDTQEISKAIVFLKHQNSNNQNFFNECSKYVFTSNQR